MTNATNSKFHILTGNLKLINYLITIYILTWNLKLIESFIQNGNNAEKTINYSWSILFRENPTWRVLASSDGISSWTPLKPQHSNPNLKPNPLANQLWSIDFLTTPTPLIIPHRLPAFFESLMPLKNSCLIHARWSKSSLKHSIRFCGISKFKTGFYCISFF